MKFPESHIKTLRITSFITFWRKRLGKIAFDPLELRLRLIYLVNKLRAAFSSKVGILLPVVAVEAIVAEVVAVVLEVVVVVVVVVVAVTVVVV